MRRRLACLVALLTAFLGVTPARAIIGGSPAPEGAWSFTAALLQEGELICGAVIVSPGWAATAAHCVAGGAPAAEFGLVVGRSSISGNGGETTGISAIRVHPRYAVDSSHDIALLALEHEAPVPPIAVADEGDNRFEADGTAVRVTGWGDQLPTLGTFASDRMREVELRVVGDDRCSQRNVGLNRANSVCAAELLKDSCQGDSGGPLFALDGGRPLLIGVVSGGIGCAVPELPGIYTEVNAAGIRSWVRTTAGV